MQRPSFGHVPGPAGKAERIAAMLSYPLFFLPLLLFPKSPFVRFHANQGLCLVIAFVSAWLLGVATYTFYIGYVVLPFTLLGGAFCVVWGIINAYRSKARPLPLIGFAKIIDVRTGNA